MIARQQPWTPPPATGEQCDLNQEQALATAAASEQATTNVGIVATAAEEIAQSIEHIAARVANSATVASQATGEARAITDAVKSLSASVDEIGEVSDLISSIAAQQIYWLSMPPSRPPAPVKPAEASP